MWDLRGGKNILGSRANFIGGDDMNKEIAKEKYATKLSAYLGVDKSKCEKVFEKLYANWKAVEALRKHEKERKKC